MRWFWLNLAPWPSPRQSAMVTMATALPQNLASMLEIRVLISVISSLTSQSQKRRKAPELQDNLHPVWFPPADPLPRTFYFGVPQVAGDRGCEFDKRYKMHYGSRNSHTWGLQLWSTSVWTHWRKGLTALPFLKGQEIILDIEYVTNIIT